jgi:hypothetical protein
MLNCLYYMPFSSNFHRYTAAVQTMNAALNTLHKPTISVCYLTTLYTAKVI